MKATKKATTRGWLPWNPNDSSLPPWQVTGGRWRHGGRQRMEPPARGTAHGTASGAVGLWVAGGKATCWGVACEIASSCISVWKEYPKFLTISRPWKVRWLKVVMGYHAQCKCVPQLGHHMRVVWKVSFCDCLDRLWVEVSEMLGHFTVICKQSFDYSGGPALRIWKNKIY